MSDYFENGTDLNNEKTVVMNADEIDEKIRLMGEQTVNEPRCDTESFVIPPDLYDMTVEEKVPLHEEKQEEFAAEPLEEQVLMPDFDEFSEEKQTSNAGKKRKNKTRNILICAIAAVVLLGILACVMIAKHSPDDAEYKNNYEMAQRYYDDGEYDKALIALRKAMSIDKTDECLLLMADCYEAKHDYVNAIAILESSNTQSAEIKDRIEELKKAQKVYEDGKKVLISGEEYQVDITTLDLSGRQLRSGELTDLERLTELTSLKLAKNRIESLAFLEHLNKLVSLDLSENDITDISVLAGLTSLKTLHLDGNKIENYEPLYNLKSLTKLSITDMKISESQLEALEDALPNCNISSDEAEKNIKAIKLGGKSFNSDVKELDLSNRGISDISALKDCTELEILNLAGNSIQDISVLMDLPKLRSLSLENNNIRDIGPLMSLTTLEYLNLSDNKISSVAAMGELTALNELSLKNNKINDFSPLSNLVLLGMLDLTNTGISDSSLQYLYKLKNLTRLALDNNSISMKAYNKLKEEIPNCNISHSDFEKITLGTKSFAADAISVNASGLDIQDISEAAGFACVEKMDLSNNNISDLKPLYELNTLKEIKLSGNKLSTAQLDELKNALPECNVIY